VAVFSTTLGPFMEEMFFRGFLYPVLKRRTGVMTAIVATALPFALMHAAQYGNSWASVMLIFMVGVVLAMVREKKNSLAAAFLVHVAYNGTIVLLMFIATGGFRHLEKLSQ
jgi:membrane protease YdiL (CAAX protease family)